MPQCYLLQKSGQKPRKFKDKEINLLPPFSAPSLALTEVSINLSSDNNDIGRKIKPDHQDNDCADTAICCRERSEAADIIGKAERHNHPAGCREYRAWQSASAGDFFVRGDPV